MINDVYIMYFPYSVVFGCWEYNNKYNVLDQNGETLLSAKEQSECIQRAFCANARAFSMPLMNPQVRCIIKKLNLCVFWSLICCLCLPWLKYSTM